MALPDFLGQSCAPVFIQNGSHCGGHTVAHIKHVIEGLSPLSGSAVGTAQELPSFSSPMPEPSVPHLSYLHNHWSNGRCEELSGVVQGLSSRVVLTGLGHDATSLVHLLLPVHVC